MDSENLTNRERCLLRAVGMLKDRMDYYANACCEEYYAYDSAVAILEFAWDEDWEALNQFDYFGKEN